MNVNHWWYAAPLLVSLLGCPPPKPTPPPDPCAGKTPICALQSELDCWTVVDGACVFKPAPTPPPDISYRPDIPVGLETLLRTKDQKFIRERQAGPFAIAGAIPCWPPDGTGEKLYVDGVLTDYYWPLVSADWIKKTTAKGFNTYHMRPGPFDVSNICCGLEDVGAPYAADGSWNQKFWSRYQDALIAATGAKANIEVDVLDGWVVKHAVYGDVNMPWPATDVQSAVKLPLNDSVRTWVKKNVYESCNYGGVIYQIGNETSLMAGWTPEWERAMYAEIRAAEQQPGCGEIVHLIGSNSRDWDGPYDYFSSHDPREGGAPVAGRPMSVNEYNPAQTVAGFHAKYCEAKKAGQAFWYWRSDGTDAVQDASLNSIDCDAPPVSTCTAPLPDRELLVWQVGCADNGTNHVCDPTPNVTRSLEYCTAIGMGEYNGQPRATCPARNECPGFDCENRLACEQYLIEAPAPVITSDGEIQYFDDNKFKVKIFGGTWVQFCNGPGTKCRKVDL